MTQPSGQPGSRTIAELRRWHLLQPESVLAPELPIVDAHHHLWDRPPDRYALDELIEDTGAGHDVRASCFVECSAMYRPSGPEKLRSLGETEWINGLAAASASGLYGRSRLCTAIVGQADLRDPDIEAVLERHLRVAGDRFRGIRQQVQYDPSLGSMARRPTTAHMLADPTFRAGLRVLGKLGLSFDAWLFFTQLSELAEAAQACPETLFVLNHIGGPIAVGPFANDHQAHRATWSSGMAALAKLDNVVVKIGGLGMISYGFGFEHRATPPASDELGTAWRPHVETAIGLFGAERCMFESNFPVDGQSCSYVALWNAYKRLTQSAGADERAALFSGTAGRVYQMDERIALAGGLDSIPSGDPTTRQNFSKDRSSCHQA